MAKPEWGSKRTCPSCGARFYDLRRETIVCPVCNTVYDPERQPKTRRGGLVRDEALVVTRTEDGAAIEDAAELDDADEEIEDDAAADTEGGDTEAEEIKSEGTDLIEDTSDLGEDDDDIGEVMEHLDDDLDEKP